MILDLTPRSQIQLLIAAGMGKRRLRPPLFFNDRRLKLASESAAMVG
jgi:hypothetical protein